MLYQKAIVTVLGALLFVVTYAQDSSSGSFQVPASTGAVSTAREPFGPSPMVPPAEQPQAKIIVDPPKPELLAQGVAFIQFRTENLQIVPVFGPAAVGVTPPIGHLHVTLDDATWHWAHTSNDPVIVAVLTPGPHKILIELVNANHETLAQEVVKFEVPRR